MNGRNVPEFRPNRLRFLLALLLDELTQSVEAGGINSSPILRLLLFSLAKTSESRTIIETGYDLGITTEAFALTNELIIAIDDHSEYGGMHRFSDILDLYPNITRLNGDALAFLKEQQDNSVDLIFIDDSHRVDHVIIEAREVKRILKTGGLAAFHDTKYTEGLADALIKELGWYYLDLDSYWNNRNLGVMIFQKPNA